MIEKSAQHPCFYRLIDASDGRSRDLRIAARHRRSVDPGRPARRPSRGPPRPRGGAARRDAVGPRRSAGSPWSCSARCRSDRSRVTRLGAAARAVGAARRRRAVRRGARPRRRLGPGLAVPGLRARDREQPTPPDARAGRRRAARAARRPGTAATSTPSSGAGSPAPVDDARPGRGLDAPAGPGRGRGDLAGPAAAGLRRLGVRASSAALDVRQLGVPQHRADRARAAPAGRRVDLPRRRDHAGLRRGRRRHVRRLRRGAGWSPGRARRCWSRRRVGARTGVAARACAQSWIRAQGRASSSS